MTLEIHKACEVTDELVEACARLIPQLSKTAPPVTAASLEKVVACPTNTLFVARLDGRIVGTLTLVVFPTPTGYRAWIEDVVVDGAAQGRQVGSALTTAALARAEELGARTVDLTSRSSRVAANQLYRKLGFEPRESNLLRFSLAD
ncbi:N-acetyltransferase [Rhodococcus sp. AD45-ID]|uniref:GNAT family N-acetyltransferase n=1 Tax=unclassified Rhodococcus (in: high G+C Gram-positive bacteria) TaxID=192944 RepID=UPI0005D32CF3|nr:MULTISPECIES: GNAT family N-acetyltransferase [unclassified Rhodococcus (in: high G+C Gram-positive bacteria)]KJF21879.1 putative acetyltransferase [Rhodococcus sp. AD45]PSR39585.1 N-acetyltransferase [Rhodococcus sp. AD45-ID]